MLKASGASALHREGPVLGALRATAGAGIGGVGEHWHWVMRGLDGMNRWYPRRWFGSADSAGRTNARHFGRPDRRPVVQPAEPPPSFSAEDHRRASPPFHSDELHAGVPNARAGARLMRHRHNASVSGSFSRSLRRICWSSSHGTTSRSPCLPGIMQS